MPSIYATSKDGRVLSFQSGWSNARDTTDGSSASHTLTSFVNAIQARKPKSHTIVECHPEIIIKLKEWASNKTNVVIVEGDWLEKAEDLSVYDSILQDTYAVSYTHLTLPTNREV